MIGWMVALSFCVMFFLRGTVGIESGVTKSDLDNAFIGIIFITAAGIPGYDLLLKIIDKIR